MKLAMIVAMAENGVIGRNNQLPWYLPEDLKYFKQTTLGKPIIMGRKTFESIGRPLPGRTNIVVSRQSDLSLPAGVRLVNSLDAAITLAEQVAEIDGADELMVIGGAEIYRAAFAKATVLYLTQVHAVVEGDAYFEGFAAADWQLESTQHFEPSGSNPYPYSFNKYLRP
ncbi:MAG: dihydrofolate reductase [Pseudomonadales bacterium]|nr:dihydrofolate reductase [Pseudomonadales bacterium]